MSASVRSRRVTTSSERTMDQTNGSQSLLDIGGSSSSRRQRIGNTSTVDLSSSNSSTDDVSLLDSHAASTVASSQRPTALGIRDQLRGDWGSVALLLLLYVLQGIPLGLCSAVPMILQNRHISYKQQAVFSFVGWPFSLKLLWAPLVDSIYFQSMGRRKSWLIPTQYLIGLFMFVLSTRVEELFGIGTDQPPKVYTITAVFFALCFLAATQDIAVDGWALTMLSRRNVGYASTCNCVGQTAGYFLGYVVFLALESTDFCNKYLRSTPQTEGVITLSSFLYFWSFVYLISTTLVWALKKERPVEDDPESHADGSISDTFKVLLRIIRLPAMQMLILFLLTMKICFAAPDSVTLLKMGDYGVPKDKLALLAIPLMPLQIILPVVISKHTAGPRPLDVLIRAYPYRLVFGLIYPLLVWLTPSMEISPGEYPYYFYGIVLVLYAVHQVTLYSMFVAIMGFFAKISDPSIGGTYMTLLNTLSNLGGNWPVTVALYFIDPLTLRRCVIDAPTNSSDVVQSCDTETELESCKSAGGRCDTLVDGYYVECLISIGIGFLWLLWGRQQVRRMQSLRERAWRTPIR